jgi:hypothetical protein
MNYIRSYVLVMKLGLLLGLVLSNNSWAGSQQATKAQHAPQDIAKFAKGIEKYAASQGARAFIIARTGRPQKDLPKNILYTHTAIAIYSEITLDSGETVNGYAIHNLYQNTDKPNRSSLIQDYPVDFFWGAYRLNAGIVIPSANIQHQLIELVRNGNDKQLHNPKYSVLASPFNNRYQNCTEHTLNMLNAAIYNTTNMAQLKANTLAHFSAQEIYKSRFSLVLGAAFTDGLTTRDHKGRVRTATFGSIARYLQKYDLADQAVIIDQQLNATPIKA